MAISNQIKYETSPFEKELMEDVEIKLYPAKRKIIEGHELAINGKGKQAQMISMMPRMVDRKTFVKIYSGHFKMLFGLSKTSQMVFAYIADQCTRIDSDKVFIDFLECRRYAEISGKNTLANCLDELCNKNIIKCSMQKNIFFINPTIIFNGSRLTIVQEITTKSDSQAYTATKGLLQQPNTNFLNETNE